ncbi:MAG: sensor histidine kinase [Lewinella sp.]|uniref:sensor histidine kinase n=1 Tax=Lewinella sp. TaxID=2004506 RepID=UPI003D6AFCD4
MKRQLLILFLGSLTGLFLRFLLSGDLEQAGAHQPLWWPWIVWGILLAYGVFYLSRQLDRWLDWHQQPGLRWLIGWISNTIVAFSFGWLGLRSYALFTGLPVLTWATFSPLLIKAALILLLLVLLYTVVYFALYSYRYHGKIKLATLRHERAQMDLQWKALSNQLQPHFLFNSLNTISALLHEDEQRAEQFIRRLAHAYQYTLETYGKNLVPLKDELQFVQSYYYLLKTRFADHLNIELDVAASTDHLKVPPLGVQLLVENAIKHNRPGAEEILRIKILTNQDWLWVINNTNETSEEKESFEVGLANLRARYELLSERKIVIKKEDQFIVKIPLLR